MLWQEACPNVSAFQKARSLEQPIIEFYYKDDALGDPLITEDHIWLLKAATPEQVETIKSITKTVNEEPSKHFRRLSCQINRFQA